MKRNFKLILAIALLTFAGVYAQQSFAALSLNTSQTGVANQSKTIQGVGSNGGFQAMGSSVLNVLGQPTAPTFTYNGTIGSTSTTYYCDAEDINGNMTIASASASATTGNATLSATNSINVFCPGEPGAVAFDVLKTDTSHTIGKCYTNSNVGCVVIDNGTASVTFNSISNGAITAGPPAVDNTNTNLSANACAGTVKVVAGSVLVTAPCVTAFSHFHCSVESPLPPVAGDVCGASPTSTATTTIVAGATTTITVGALNVQLAGTPSPSPIVEWGADR